MPYRVDLTARAIRNLGPIYQTINAEDAAKARAWFNGLEQAISSLHEHPAREATTPEASTLRHLLYGRRWRFRFIYAIDETDRVVTVLHIHHGARGAFVPDEQDDVPRGPIRSG